MLMRIIFSKIRIYVTSPKYLVAEWILSEIVSQLLIPWSWDRFFFLPRLFSQGSGQECEIEGEGEGSAQDHSKG